MKKTLKTICSGAMLLLLGLFFYSGYLFYENNPSQNPFIEEKEPVAVEVEKNYSDQVEGDRFVSGNTIKKNNFVYKPMPSYTYYRTKAMNTKEFVEMREALGIALSDYNKTSDKASNTIDSYNEKSDEYIKGFWEKANKP